MRAPRPPHLCSPPGTIIVVLSNAFGDLFLTLGMKQHAAELSLSPVAYIAAMFSPWVATGIALLVVWMLTRMALFGWADLSVVPYVNGSVFFGNAPKAGSKLAAWHARVNERRASS